MNNESLHHLFSVDRFLILVGHSQGTDMSDELYHSSLGDICKNQVEIGALADNDNFISVGYVYNPEQLSFSKS